MILSKQNLDIHFSRISKLFLWFFKISNQVNSSDFHITRVSRCSFLGSWINLGAIYHGNLSGQNITFLFGIKRFHLDLELNFIIAPEMEVRADKKIHYKNVIEKNAILKRGFLGWEGIGIYGEKTLVHSIGVSKIEIGAHPMISVGACNFYHELTQHAVIGCQLLNFQVDLHAAFDSSA